MRILVGFMCHMGYAFLVIFLLSVLPQNWKWNRNRRLLWTEGYETWQFWSTGNESLCHTDKMTTVFQSINFKCQRENGTRHSLILYVSQPHVLSLNHFCVMSWKKYIGLKWSLLIYMWILIVRSKIWLEYYFQKIL